MPDPTTEAKAILVATTATLIDPNPGVTFSVGLTYRPADPFTVTVTLHETPGEPVVWQLARDLLAAGVDKWSGYGDVQVCPFPSLAAVGLTLTSPDGHCVLRLPAGDVARFLALSYRAVPAGAERVDVDAVLAAILAADKEASDGPA